MASEKKVNRIWIISLILCTFFGWIGAHRLYNKKIFSGLIFALNSFIYLGCFLIMILNIANHSSLTLNFFLTFTGIQGIMLLFPIWLFVDFILIITGNFRDNNGEIISIRILKEKNELV